MITTEQLIETTVAQYVVTSKQASVASLHAAIDKAAAIVTSRTLVREDDGTWSVRDTAGSGKTWKVNGRCTCPAALKDQRTTGVEKGICKHRIAVKFARRLENHFKNILALQHTHHCETCRTPMTCWAEPCKEVVDVLACPACQVNDGLSPIPPCPEDCGGCAEEAIIQAEMDQSEAEYQEEKEAMDEAPTTLTPEELTTLAAPAYEENPQSGPCPVCFLALDAIDHAMCRRFEASVGHDVPPATLAMPEVPASLNIKVKVGQFEVMYTARSMQTGAAGDEELASRLPAIIKAVEALKDHWTPEPRGGK